MPKELEIQVLAFMRLTWGEALFCGDDQFRDRLWDYPEATHFIRAAGDVLVSHAEVFMTSATGSDGRDLRIAGVSSVLTYPQFRHEGHGSAVMRRADRHILESTADVGMLFTDKDLDAFYRPLGWQEAKPGSVLVGDRQPDDFVMLFGRKVSTVPKIIRVEWQW